MNRDKERIEALLERYFDATATDAEERELRDYFRSSDDVPASLRYAQAMFCGMDSLAAEEFPADGEVREPVSYTADCPESQPESCPVPPPEKRQLRHMPLVWTAVAAALLFGIFLCIDRFRQPYCYIDGVAVYDKEVAMQATAYLDGFGGFTDPGQMVDELMKNE